AWSKRSREYRYNQTNYVRPRANHLPNVFVLCHTVTTLSEEFAFSCLDFKTSISRDIKSFRESCFVA
ncbi:MAG: hypothetical protein ACPL4N_02245, partial [Candidatus Norongarragalinales archaeon]